jgi:hypothetical protein
VARGGRWRSPNGNGVPARLRAAPAASGGEGEAEAERGEGVWRLVCRLRLVLPLVPDTTGTARGRTSPACLPALSSATYVSVGRPSASPLGARFGWSGRGRGGGCSGAVPPASLPSTNSCRAVPICERVLQLERGLDLYLLQLPRLRSLVGRCWIMRFPLAIGGRCLLRVPWVFGCHCTFQFFDKYFFNYTIVLFRHSQRTRTIL